MKAQTRVLFTDTTMRDAHQSLLATRMRTYDITRVARSLFARAAESVLARMLGRSDVRRRHAVPQRGPLGAAGGGARRRAQHSDADAAARLERRRLHQLSRQCGEVLRARRRRRAASMCSASSTASTGSKTCASRSTRWPRRARSPRAPSATPATCLDPNRAKYDLKYYVGLAKELEAAGAHVLGHQGHGGAAASRRRRTS